MVNIIITSILIALFFFLGYITQAFKKLIGLVSKLMLKLFNLLGIRLHNKEKQLQMSNEFRETYKDIKIVKLSKKNLKEKSSIDWVYFSLFIVAGLLVLLNFGGITDNAISNWLFEIQPIKFIKTATDMNVFYTATLFSVLSFSLSKVLARWKETKQQRIEHKEAILKLKAMQIMSSKELLDNAKKKDEQKYKELK